MDRQWMYADRRSKEFIDGVHYFLRVAKANRHKGFICCPCNKCKNQKEYSASRTIHFHLFESGFMPSYNCWTSHGEQGVEMKKDKVEDDNIPDFAQYAGFEGNQTGEEERDADGNDVADDLGQMLQDTKEYCESEKGAHKLDKMLEDHRTSLYPGCEQGHKKLDPTLEFLQWKAKNSVSDKAFGDLLKLVKNILPEGNKLPKTTNKGNARMMRWHAEERQQDEMLRHPADDSQWRNINRKFKDFGKDARNIRFGLSTDGMNPFGEMSNGYSTWPVTMCIYNLPPWLCMKRKYIIMPIIIQGPKQPGNNIDVYLRPLVEDLKLLWKKEGVPELPYWEFLDVRHAIDVMHLTKNLCVNLLGFLGVYGKSKDTLEARNDLKHMEQRGDLHSEPKEKGSHYLSPASYTLSKAEKENMFECLESINVPSGYSTNIKRIISTKEKKFTNLKSHDCHVLMTQLLPVVIRGILPDNVRATIIKLCAFMNAISQNVIDPDILEALQNDVVQCLVSFELIFPPSFFNIMTHLLCHFVKEIGILGPVYLHNMFPFERYMGVLKKYVRNRAHPEASIAKGYGTEEVIEFCVEFIEDLRPIGGYEINGYTFYTRAQDIKCTNQNSVVRIDAMGHDGTTGTYYGAIEDIWELDYGPLKVPPFRCQWVRLTGGGVTIDDSGMTMVDLNKVGYSDEPFVLSNDVTQVFYVKDMSSKGKKGRGEASRPPLLILARPDQGRSDRPHSGGMTGVPWQSTSQYYKWYQSLVSLDWASPPRVKMLNEVNHVGKAPMFNGTNYSTWKIKMSTHLKAMSFHIWSIVDVGFAITGTHLTGIDHRNLQLNAQAMNALFNCLSQEECDRVSNLETAYENWNKLAEIHEGTSEYNDAKLHFLKIQYETFSMLPHESVNAMYGRLNASWGKINTNDMYKLKKKEMEETSPSKKCIAPQAEVEDKGKGKCFECGEKRHFASKCPSKDDDGDKSSMKKSGGYKLMKKLKKEGKKIEVFIGDWVTNEESSASSGSEEEGGDDASSKKKKMAVVAIKEAPSPFAPLCLMAKGSSKVTSLSDSESDDDCDYASYDELVSMFEELHAYSEKEIVKFKALKKDHASLEVLYEELKTSHERLTISHEKLKEAHDNLLSTYQHGALIDVGISCVLLDDSATCHIAHVASSSISTSCDDLVDMPSSSSSPCVSICDASLVENNELKEQVAKLNKSLERCFKGKNTLDKILSEQRCILNKEGLGFIPKKGKKPSHRATRFVKSNGRLMMVALLLDMWVLLYSVVNYRTGGSHWVLDSGCTQHMTGDRAMFTTFDVGGNEQEKGVRLTKFESRCDEGFLLGYVSNSKAYRVYNKNKGIVEETADVQFDETNGSQEGHENLDDVGDEGLMRAMKNMSIRDVKPIEVEDKPSTSTQDEPSTFATPSQAQVEVEEEKAQDPPMPQRIHTALSKDHPIDQVLGDISKDVQTRSRVASICEHYSFVSCLEPKHVDEALCDLDWMNAMHEELNNFARNKVWTLVERPRDHNVIGTKWVFRNKQDEKGLVVRSKARLVAQDFTQVEGLDFGETFAPVARLEAIRILLAFASCFDIKLFQMDVKSAFLNGEIAELVFVEQPPGFEDPKNPNHVYKLSKALYGLKPAPRAWYERLRDFLLPKDFKIGKVDTTLSTKIIDDDFVVCQIYVDDIIFGSTNEVFCKEFGDMMSREFEMSMVGELSFFLGLQIKQLKDGTFVSQTKYIKDLLKRFGLEDAKPIKTPMATNGHLDLDEGGKPVDLKLYHSMIGSLLYLTASRPDIMFSVCMCARFQAAPKKCHLVAVKRILRYLKHSSTIGLWYPKGAKFKIVSYSDLDYAVCKVDRKSTSGSCQMLGRSLVSWSSKKQNSVALSTAEAEYVSAGSCCAQLLWMKQTLLDYGISFTKTPLLCDNDSAIKIANNPVQHSRTKHIDIRYHFLKDHVVAKSDIVISHIRTENQLADIFTKPLDETRFCKLRNELNVIDFSNVA
uniref:Transposon protein, putative, CACTA, En/Spm sub-class n=2 Tax=Oryza sativa subsp. japonica TaxID=39947 RepID=Q10K37_ORYSJ|nr:transposon protein, putative, CACTA, En/Spm sub-class [Oryza sativa Japonica Group]ABF96438.1 transposon protein, putative, CACTA, En/Spm sub-class [Oryza sativa Japonica Group]